MAPLAALAPEVGAWERTDPLDPFGNVGGDPRGR